MPELPPVIATFVANISDFKAKVGEAQEQLTKTAALSKAEMAEIEASVNKQVAEMAAAAKLAGEDFDKTATKAELMSAKVEEASGKSSGAFSKMASLGKVALVGIVTAAIGVGYESIKAADKFNVSMASIQGNAQVTSKQATGIGDAFLSTAGKTTVSAQQMATAFAPVAGVVKSLAGGNLTAAASLDVMKAATTGAEASGLSLNSSTKDLVGVMQAFKIGTSGSADTMNDLYNTSRVTGVGIDTLSATVEKLHTKLGPVAPTLADTSAIMVDLAKNGVVGSKGVMAINTGMTTLLGGSKATSAELKKLGVNVYNSKGQFVGMSSTLAQLQPKLAGMTQQQRDLAEKTLFGAGAANAMNLVVQGGAKGLAAASTAVNTHGAAEAAAAAKSKTLSAQWEILKSAVEDLYVKIGEKLIPIITKVIAVGVKWGDWLAKHKGVLIAIAAVVGGLLVTAIAAYTVSMLTAAAATIAATWPILAIIAAVVLLGVGIYELYKHWSTIWGDIKKVASDVSHFIVGIFNDIWSFLKKWGPLILTVLAPFLGLPLLIYQHWSAIVSFFEGLWGDVESAFSKALTWVSNFFTSLPGKVLGWLKGAGTWLLNLGKDVINGLWNGLKAAWGAEVAGWEKIGTTIKGWFTGALKWLAQIGSDIITGLWSGMTTIWNRQVTGWQRIGTTVKGWFNGAIGWLKTLGSNIISGLFSGITSLWNRQVTGWQNIGTTIKNWFSGAASWLIDAGEDIIRGLIKGISNLAGDVGGAIKSTLGKIPGAGSLLSHIPGLATGGIVTSPTLALIGEDGPEAVVPLGMFGKSGTNGVKSLPQALGTVAPATASAGSGTTVINRFEIAGSILDYQGFFKAFQEAALQFGSTNTATYQPFGR